MKISNRFGKFGGLLAAHRVGVDADIKDGNTIDAGISNFASGNATKPRDGNPIQPDTRRPVLGMGPFSGKIVFRKGL